MALTTQRDKSKWSLIFERPNRREKGEDEREKKRKRKRRRREERKKERSSSKAKKVWKLTLSMKIMKISMDLWNSKVLYG